VGASFVDEASALWETLDWGPGGVSKIGDSRVVVGGVSEEAPVSVVSSAVESSAGVSLIWVSATANVLLGTRAKRVRANVGIDLTPGQTL
jgi:hypothetical protein